MSKENLDQFVQKVTDDEQLQARIGDEIDIDSLIALGTEHGFEFTAEDLAANVELSDEELDGVAGGVSAIKNKQEPFRKVTPTELQGEGRPVSQRFKVNNFRDAYARYLFDQ